MHFPKIGIRSCILFRKLDIKSGILSRKVGIRNVLGASMACLRLNAGQVQPLGIIFGLLLINP